MDCPEAGKSTLVVIPRIRRRNKITRLKTRLTTCLVLSSIIQIKSFYIKVTCLVMLYLIRRLPRHFKLTRTNSTSKTKIKNKLISSSSSRQSPGSNCTIPNVVMLLEYSFTARQLLFPNVAMG